MDGPKVQIYIDHAGDWRWRCIAANNEIIATGEAHTREDDAVRAARNASETLAHAFATAHVETR